MKINMLTGEIIGANKNYKSINMLVRDNFVADITFSNSISTIIVQYEGYVPHYIPNDYGDYVNFKIVNNIITNWNTRNLKELSDNIIIDEYDYYIKNAIKGMINYHNDIDPVSITMDIDFAVLVSNS